MKAVNHYLVIERIKDEPTNIGGLILTEETDVDNRYLKAKVISTGNIVEGIKDKFYHVIKQIDVVLID